MMPSIGPGSWPDCWSASCSSRTWLDGTALLRGFDPSAADAPTASIPPRNSGATIIEPTRRSMVCRIEVALLAATTCASRVPWPINALALAFQVHQHRSREEFSSLGSSYLPLVDDSPRSLLSDRAHDNKKNLEARHARGWELG